MDQITYNSITLNSLINTVAWSIHFKIVFKILGFLDVENKLKLNNDKTEATLPLQHKIFVSDTKIEFSGIIHNFGFIFDIDLLMKPHIIKACKTA